jgi:hypothetical protein
VAPSSGLRDQQSGSAVREHVVYVRHFKACPADFPVLTYSRGRLCSDVSSLEYDPWKPWSVRVHCLFLANPLHGSLTGPGTRIGQCDDSDEPTSAVLLPSIFITQYRHPKKAQPRGGSQGPRGHLKNSNLGSTTGSIPPLYDIRDDQPGDQTITEYR